MILLKDIGNIVDIHFMTKEIIGKPQKPSTEKENLNTVRCPGLLINLFHEEVGINSYGPEIIFEPFLSKN